MTTTAIPDLLAGSRAVTLALVAPLSERQIETQYTPLMSPLAWDLAHIAAYEDLWIGHRHGGLPLLQPELAAVYDAFETLRPVRGSLPLLDAYDNERPRHAVDVAPFRIGRVPSAVHQARRHFS